LVAVTLGYSEAFVPGWEWKFGRGVFEVVALTTRLPRRT
jgi:hypothetical protein